MKVHTPSFSKRASHILIRQASSPFIVLFPLQCPGKISHSSSGRRRTSLFPCLQGDRRCLSRQGSFKTVRTYGATVGGSFTGIPHTHSPTAVELLQTPFFKSAKKKSYLVGTILNGLPPLTARQERRRLPDSLNAQRTTDSWDFSSTAMSSLASSLNAAGPRIVQKTKTLSITSERNHGDEQETRGHLSKDNNGEPPRQTTEEPSPKTSPLKSEVPSAPHPTIPVPVVRRGDGSVHRPASSSASMMPPNSTTPSLWNKLTRRSSRNVLVEEDFSKGNTISRFLGRHRSSSLAQHPTFSPS